MAEELGRAVLYLEADNGLFVRSMGAAERRAHSFVRGTGRLLGSLAKRALVTAGAGGLAALGLTLYEGEKRWRESTKAIAQTRAVLKSTHGAAHVTLRDTLRLSKAIQDYSGISREQVQSGQDTLLMFTAVRNQLRSNNLTYTDAIKLTADLSVRTGKDMVGSARLLGKALNDPSTGLGMLRRAGVSFTAQQTDQIKKMQASGHLLKAQGMVIDALKTRVEGAARAYGKTLPGQFAIAREKFKDLSERVFVKMVPVLKQIVDWINSHWPQISRVFSAVATGVKWAVENVIKPAIHGITVAGQYVVNWVRSHWPQIRSIAQQAWSGVSRAITAVYHVASGLFNSLAGWIRRHRQDLKDIARIVAGALAGAWRTFKSLAAAVFHTVIPLARSLWSTLKSIYRALNILLGPIGGVKGAMRAMFTTVLGPAHALTGVLNGIRSVINWLKANVPGAGVVFRVMAATAMGPLGGLIAALEHVQSLINAVKSAASSISGGVPGHWHKQGGKWVHTGSADRGGILPGLGDGLTGLGGGPVLQDDGSPMIGALRTPAALTRDTGNKQGPTSISMEINRRVIAEVTRTDLHGWARRVGAPRPVPVALRG